MKQYRFRAQSKLSFPIQHNGRNTYVSFGSLYSGVSRFMTTDALLAEKIRKHQWFRIGLIKEDEPIVIEKEDEPIVIEKEENQSTPVAEEQQVQETSIFAQPLFSGTEPKATEDEPKATEDEDTNQDETQGIRPEDVTSLVEAKDYLKTYYAAPREAIATRDKVIEFCKQNNIVFPNLDL